MFKAYPQLANVNVKFVSKLSNDANGSYNPTTNTITIKSSLDNESAKSTMSHEIQHAIQLIEGFETGGNSLEALSLVRDVARNYLIKSGKINNVPINQVDSFVDGFLKKQFNTNDINDVAYKAYKLLYGEKEARKVQERLGMGVVERKNLYPEYAERSWTKDEYGQTNMARNSKQNNIANSSFLHEKEGQMQSQKGVEKIWNLEQGLNNNYQSSFASPKITTDSEYDSAVKSGDTTKAEQLVKEAANKAGFTGIKKKPCLYYNGQGSNTQVHCLKTASFIVYAKMMLLSTIDLKM